LPSRVRRRPREDRDAAVLLGEVEISSWMITVFADARARRRAPILPPRRYGSISCRSPDAGLEYLQLGGLLFKDGAGRWMG